MFVPVITIYGYMYGAVPAGIVIELTPLVNVTVEVNAVAALAKVLRYVAGVDTPPESCQ